MIVPSYWDALIVEYGSTPHDLASFYFGITRGLNKGKTRGRTTVVAVDRKIQSSVDSGFDN